MLRPRERMNLPSFSDDFSKLPKPFPIKIGITSFYTMHVNFNKYNIFRFNRDETINICW